MNKTEEELVTETEPDAERALRREAVLAAVIEAEGIEVDDDEILDTLRQSAAAEPGGKEPSDKALRRSLDKARKRGQDEALREDIAMRKAVDVIVDSATAGGGAQGRGRQRALDSGGRQAGEEGDLDAGQLMEYAAAPAAIAGTQSFLTRVFAWMVVGLLVTAASAAVIGSSDGMLADVTSNPILLIILFVAQLGLVITISAGVNRMSTGAAGALFLLYSALNGFIFSLVFELYTDESIFTTFLVAASMFASLALLRRGDHQARPHRASGRSCSAR